MKKYYQKILFGWIVFIIIAFLIVNIFLIEESKYFEYEIIYTDNITSSTTLNVCASINDNYEVITVEVNDCKNIYETIFSLYNYNRNMLPLGYQVPSNKLLDYIKIQKNDDTLYIKLKDQLITDKELERIMKVMKITYSYYEIKNLEVEINNKIYKY